jgi:hypothetical protein
MPADTVPMTPGKASKSPDNLRDRLDNMGIPKTSALERLQVASYLSQFADADVLAEYLGVLPELQAWEGYHDKEEASAV